MWRGALTLLACCVMLSGAHAGNANQPLGNVPEGTRSLLAERLGAYVKHNRARDWKDLYDFISEVGRGGVTRERFTALMAEAHGKEFANFPDLMDFEPGRAELRRAGAYDIYGCARAQREGAKYEGIAVIHAVFEHDNWFFTGWTFAGFPNVPCKKLSNPEWKPSKQMEWNRAMDELRPIEDVQPKPKK